MADVSAVQAAAFDAVAESPQFTPIPEPPRKVNKMFHLEQSKKDILLALTAVIIILVCIIYIPYNISDNFKFFLYAVTIVPASMGLGYAVVNYRSTKKIPAST